MTAFELRTADGRLLSRALARAERGQKITAFLLALPLIAFIFFGFLVPIALMLRTAVISEVRPFVPKTAAVLSDWSGLTTPDEEVFVALHADMVDAERGHIGRVARAVNATYPGAASQINRTARRAVHFERPYRAAFLEQSEIWSDPLLWSVLKDKTRAISYDRFATSLGDPYRTLFVRTLWMSGLITLLCILLAYPVSYFLATQPPNRANLFMILVLLPFWTSLLVRTSAWIALLQNGGLLNDLIEAVGLERMELIHNKVGTIVAMTHILLPFMVLPLYSIMRGINPSFTRAARSLGANAFVAHFRVFFPLTLPGISAGVLLVFVLAIGYYITPSLVGGSEGVFISSTIADQISKLNNWGLASAMGTVLLMFVLVFYAGFNWLVGVDRLKLG